MRADADRRRESLSSISGAREQDDRLIELPLDPADVDITCVATVGSGIRKHARHVLKLEVGFITLECLHHRSILVPSPATIDRAPHEDAVFPRAVRPVRGATELLEVQRSKINATL